MKRARTYSRSRRHRALLALRLLLALALVVSTFAGLTGSPLPQAQGATAIAQTYYTPFEAQQFIDMLRTIAADPACCDTSVESTISITSGADGNTVIYDHFEDGFEADPFAPVQASTVTLTMDSGDVWTQSSTIPIDGPGRGAGNFFDGRDKIISVAPIAVTQAGYATNPGTVHAGAVQVLDIDKSGLAFDIPAGQDANYNGVFDYVGLVIIANEDATTVQIDANADGAYELTVPLSEGESHLVDGGVNLGASVIADKPVATYVATGDNGATYEGRFFELYPTAIWSGAMASPVGSHSGSHQTRVFLFNPGNAAINVDVTDGGGGSTTISIAAGAQETFLMPVDEGARFASQGGEPFYGFQAITTEDSSTSAYDWAFTLIPEAAVTPSVIVPYGPGSQGLTNNYSPVWVAANADTTLYVDRDGDPTTGALVDANGDRYDFDCAVTAYESVTVYDDGTTNCYSPSQSSAGGGGRDLTGARLYALGGARLSSAWGQRPNYTAGAPALDMGTTILPFPTIVLTKSSALTSDVDGDGLIDGGDQVTYTIGMQNLGIVDVGSVLTIDETPLYSTYVPNSTTLDAVPQADDPGPFSPSPLDADSPAGGLDVGSIPAGATRVAIFTVQVDDPIPIGINRLDNLVTMTTDYGSGTASVTDPLDVPPLQIEKASSPSATPVPSGATIDYTIRVFNGDTSTQTGIDVVDTLPTGTTYQAASVAADIDGVPILANPPPLLVSGASLDPGQMLTITFTVDTDLPMPAGVTTFRNEAAASSTQYPVPVTDDSEDDADPKADLRISKVDDTAVPLNPGDRLTYTISVNNDGPDDAAAVQVVDTLPPNVTNNAGLSDPACAEGPVGTVTCALGDMAAGAGTSFDIVVDLDAGASGTLTNLAVVSSSTPDPDPNNNRDTEDTPVDTLPSITVTKTPSTVSVPEPGGPVTFTIDVENLVAEDVTLTSLVDDVFGDLLAGPLDPSVTANTCDDALPVTIGASATFTCTLDADLVGNFGDPDHVNTASATVDDGEGNTATDNDSATVSFADGGAPTIVVTKTPSVGSVPEPGGTVTYTITVENASAEAVTLTVLDDDVFGNLLDPANPDISANTCDTEPTGIGVGGTFSCTFDADLVGNFGDPDHVNTVSATVDDGEGNLVTESDDATVGFGDARPSIVVVKTPSIGTVPEPGGTVTFTVDVNNTSAEAVTLTVLDDDVFGDLLDPANPDISANTCDTEPTLIAVGGAFSCTFDADLTGDFGDPDHVNTVTGTVDDGDGNVVSDDGSATVVFGDEAPTITVTKTPSVASVPEPGDDVTFTVTVENTSVEAVTLTALDDDVFGNLLDPANPDVDGNTCSTEPTLIGVGATFSCTFDADVSGVFGDPDHVNTVTGTVDDGEGNIGTDDDDATVVFDDVPPTLNVWKIAHPGSVPEPGATVTFTVEVDNTSMEEVTLTVLTDDVFGDLLDPTNALVDDNTCPTTTTLIPVAGTFTCSFDAFVAGDFGDPDHENTVTATVDDGDGNTETESGSEVVRFDAADGTLTGHLFVDSDGDGSQDADEPDLPGIDVIVTDADGITYTVTSDADGDWSVDVALGDAHLAVDPLTVPGGYELTTDNETQTVTVPAGGVASDPIGYQPEPAALSGRVFLDLNGDVVQTVPEPGLAGVTVNLLDASGVEIATMDTDADGDYRFGGLAPGRYTVEVDERTVLDGLVLSGDPDGVLDAETTVTLEAGDSEDDLDFAYEGTGSIGDTVWLDEDEDGVEDPGEDPISGVVVELRWAGFDGVFGTSDDWVFPVEVTGADGLYRFWDLPPGKYRVEVDLDTVADDLAPTTPIDFNLDLGASEDYDDGDAGFAQKNDEPLPQTGIEAQTLGLWGIILTVAGLLLLLLGRRRRVTVHWDRI